MERGYNGWANWETWNFMLWHGDDMRQCVNELAEHNHDKIEYGDVHQLIEGYIDNLMEQEEYPTTGFIGDAIGMAIQRLDIHEIAQYIYDDMDNDLKY